MLYFIQSQMLRWSESSFRPSVIQIGTIFVRSSMYSSSSNKEVFIFQNSGPLAYFPLYFLYFFSLFSLSFLLATISGPCSQRVIFTARIKENWNVLPESFALQLRILTRMITVVWFVETIVDRRKFNQSGLSRWEHFQLSRRMMIGRQNPETEVIIRNNSSRPASA